MKQSAYPEHPVSSETYLLGYENTNPKLTRNYKAINISGGNFSNLDLTFIGDRTHDFDGFNMSWTNMVNFTATANSAPTIGEASFDWSGFGTLDTDVTHRFGSGSGVTFEMYGDNSAGFFGNIGINTSPSAGIGLNIGGGFTTGMFSTGTSQGFFGNSTNGFGGRGDSINNSGLFGNSTNGRGVEGTGQTGGYFVGLSTGVFAFAGASGTAGSFNSLGTAIRSDGVARIVTNGFSDPDEASAALQVGSNTQGFLTPRMTQAQRLAISSPAIGLEVYQTNGTEGKYIYKSTGWTFVI